MTSYKTRIVPGTARRWIRRNWHIALWSSSWTAAGYGIMQAVRASRVNPDAVGGEVFVFCLCLAMAIAGAVREKR